MKPEVLFPGGLQRVGSYATRIWALIRAQIIETVSYVFSHNIAKWTRRKAVTFKHLTKSSERRKARPKKL